MALVRAGSVGLAGGLAAMLDRRRARRKERCSRGLMVEGAEVHVRKVKGSGGDGYHVWEGLSGRGRVSYDSLGSKPERLANVNDVEPKL